MVKLGQARIICLQGRLHRDKKRHDVGATRGQEKPQTSKPEVCATLLRVTQPQTPVERVNAIRRCRGKACPTRRSAWQMRNQGAAKTPDTISPLMVQAICLPASGPTD